MIALTGYGQERDRDTAIKAGFNHHLVKPASLAQLTALLNRVRAACLIFDRQ